MKILLLEDDIALNRAIKKVTEINKHITSAYFDGQEVFDNIEEHFDLYILDINVPNINGLKLLDIILTKNNTAKVIIISSNTDINSLKKAYEFGCLDYLKKPFHLEELRIKIEQLNILQRDLLSDIRFKNNDDVFTKKEKDLLSLLVSNSNTLVTYAMIDENVYKDKSMSLDSLRALVRRLRLKLADDIIQNVLEEGYKITHV